MTPVFKRLVVARTYPMVWGRDAAQLTESMAALFESLLDPALEGVAAYSRRGGVGEWLFGDDALAALASDVGSWKAAVPKASNAQEAFDLHVNGGPDSAISFDYRRLAAASRRSGREIEIGSDEVDALFSFRSDWSLLGSDSDRLRQVLAWTPLLMVSAGPFDSIAHAPQSIDGTVAGRDWNPQDGGSILEHRLWLEAQAIFTDLRYAHNIPDARFEIDGEPLRAPAFYLLSPSGSESNGPSIIGTTEWRAAIRDVADETLRTRRLAAGFIKRGAIEDRIVGFRRVFSNRTFYLLFDTVQGDSFARDIDVFGPVVEQMSYVEATAAALSTQVTEGTNAKIPLLAAWRSSIDAAADLDSQLFDELTLESSTRRSRDRRVEIVERLHAGFRRFERITGPQIADIRAVGAEFSATMDETVRLVQRRIGFSPAPDGVSELDDFSGLDLLIDARASVDDLVEYSDDLGELLDKTTAYWGQTVVEERSSRNELLGQHERLVGVGLAMLAALGALPFLIGGLNWDELSAELDSWPGWLQGPGGLIQSTHRYLVAMTVLLSAFLVFFLLGVLVYRIRTRLRRRPGLAGELGELMLEVRSQSSATTSAAASSDWAVADASDQQCLAVLLRAALLLEESFARQATDLSIVNSIDLLLSKMEMFDYRPAIIAGPREALLYLFSSKTLLGAPIISDEEISDVLRFAGYTDSDMSDAVACLSEPSLSLEAASILILGFGFRRAEQIEGDS